MKILWVKSDFLHPTTRGGQIRTLEILRVLHQRHEVHYVGLDDGSSPEGPARASEYSTRAYAIPHRAPAKPSIGFTRQLIRGLVSPLPVAVARWQSPAQRRRVESLLATERFDSLVCDFLFPVPNIPDISRAVLFQHNVESTIWRRRVEHASNPVTRAYLGLQARRMEQLEGDTCRRAGHIIAVSAQDAQRMREDFGATRISEIPTGVNLTYFAPPAGPGPATPESDLVFIGSMDWMPNVDGVEFFVRDVLPLIHARHPRARVAIVGRTPPESVRALAQRDPRVTVTGTVPDVRPYLWGSKVSIVPLRIGGGTRLKIFEAVAAGTPVVSTTIGAEGLPLQPGEHIALADSAERFADACCALLEHPARRAAMATAALAFVASRFSSESVGRRFEQILEAHPFAGRPS